MATGLLVNGSCLENATAAQDFYFSSFPVVSRYDSLNDYMVNTTYQKNVDIWRRVDESCVVGSCSPLGSSVAVVPAFPVCVAPSEYFLAGAEFGGWVVLLLVIGFSCIGIAQVLRG